MCVSHQRRMLVSRVSHFSFGKTYIELSDRSCVFAVFCVRKSCAFRFFLSGKTIKTSEKYRSRGGQRAKTWSHETRRRLRLMLARSTNAECLRFVPLTLSHRPICIMNPLPLILMRLNFSQYIRGKFATNAEAGCRMLYRNMKT